jgi:hypothetical protein
LCGLKGHRVLSPLAYETWFSPRRTTGYHGAESTRRRFGKRAARSVEDSPASIEAGPLPAPFALGMHHRSLRPPAEPSPNAPCSDLVRPSRCDAASPEIRARPFAHARRPGPVFIRYRSLHVWSAGFSLPIARTGARHSIRLPRREATRSRHVVRPARRRAAPTSRFPRTDHGGHFPQAYCSAPPRRRNPREVRGSVGPWVRGAALRTAPAQPSRTRAITTSSSGVPASGDAWRSVHEPNGVVTSARVETPAIRGSSTIGTCTEPVGTDSGTESGS